NCASCHAFDGAKVGTVVPIEEIGTDRGRLDSYTYEFLSNQNTLFTDITYKGEDQRFQNFRKTNGYANMPLDGIWLRAPYLHNGSVPTLKDLLAAPDNRPQEFYRGYDVFDRDKVGFVSDVAEEQGKQYFKFDTKLPGNSNSGHLYGIDLDSKDKEALVEYLKTL
ncbi:MAG: cytochrome c, partial [Symploca sp. SIO1B1]|nr:cytochrome c [Symploca sp. SIO1B1]